MIKTAAAHRIAAGMATSEVARIAAEQIRNLSLETLVGMRYRRIAALAYLEKHGAYYGGPDHGGAMAIDAQRMVDHVEAEIAHRVEAIEARMRSRHPTVAKHAALLSTAAAPGVTSDKDPGDDPDDPDPERVPGPDLGPGPRPGTVPGRPGGVSGQERDDLFDGKTVESKTVANEMNTRAGLAAAKLSDQSHFLVDGDVKDLSQDLFMYAWKNTKEKWDHSRSTQHRDDVVASIMVTFEWYMKARVKDLWTTALRDKRNPGGSRPTSLDQLLEKGFDPSDGAPDEAGAFDRSIGAPDLHFDERELLASLPRDLSDGLAFVLDELANKPEDDKGKRKRKLDREIVITKPGEGGKRVDLTDAELEEYRGLSRPEQKRRNWIGERRAPETDRKTNMPELIAAFEKDFGMKWEDFKRRLAKTPGFLRWWETQHSKPLGKREDRRGAPKKTGDDAPLDYAEHLYGAEGPDGQMGTGYRGQRSGN